MATITVDTWLDDGTARTAGESWTMNGGVLTVRTDTRVHIGAPAGMTGTFTNTTSSPTLTGAVFQEGRNVREVWFDGGSGTVPAVGTNITQGAASGYLLGVWPDLTSAPVAPGGAMPVTGFLKFREVTGGAFAAGALTGITATALGEDVTSWIEIVQRQNGANTVPRLGNYTARGAPYYLANTTGVAGQIFQVPTNGGGWGTQVPAIQIETTPGSGVYEWYCAMPADLFNPTNLSTDARCKFVMTLGNGQVRIGSDGTTDCGYVPPAGCRVRVGNIFWRQTSAASDAANLAPNLILGVRPDFSTSNAGVVDLEWVTSDWYHVFGNAYRVRHVNCALFDGWSTSNNADKFIFDKSAIGCTADTAAIPFAATNCTYGGTLSNSRIFRGHARSGGTVFSITGTNDLDVNNLHYGLVVKSRLASQTGTFSVCEDVRLEDIWQYNTELRFSTTTDATVKRLDHCETMVGNAFLQASTCSIVRTLTPCRNILVDGVTTGMQNTIAGFHAPVGVMFNYAGTVDCTVRNVGSIDSPIRVESAAVGPTYLAQDAGFNINLRFQRIYADYVRTNAYPCWGANTSTGTVFESVQVVNNGYMGNMRANDAFVKGNRAPQGILTGGDSSVYGTNYFDAFTSDTEGEIWFTANEPTALNASNVALTLNGVGGFTSTSSAAMPTVGDSLVIEMPYSALGHTAFRQPTTLPFVTGTNPQHFNYEYDLDKGSGFSGTWKTLVKVHFRIAGGLAGTNTFTVGGLSEMPEVGDFVFTNEGTQIPPGTFVTDVTGNVVTLSNNIIVSLASSSTQRWFAKEIFDETISPTGVRVKIRVTTATAAASNAVSHVRIPTASTFAAQRDNLHILDPVIPVTVDATVLPDTRVQLYNVTQAAILDNVFLTGTAYSFILNTAVDGDIIRLRTTKKGYLPTESLAVFSGNSIGFVINQQVDTVYVGYGIDGATVTKFEADYVDLEVDLIVNSNFTAKEAYAWYSNAITTEPGINLFYGGVTAIDAGNLRINTDVVDLFFDNDTPNNVLQGDNIRIFRSDEQYPVKNPSTGGGGIDLVWRNQVYIAETGTSGLTTEEAATLAKLDTLTEDVSGLRFTAKALEESPSSSGGGATVAEIRAELAPELARMDVAVSTRLASTSYIAPDNVNIGEIKTKVDTLQNTDLTAIDAALSDIKGTGYEASRDNLVKIKQQASLAAALSA